MARFVLYDTAQFPKIREAAESEEWFTAIVLCAVQLERHSYWTIKELLEFRGIEPKLVRLLIEPLYLSNFAECLLSLKKIDKKEYDTIMKINDARRHFIHRRGREKFKRGREARESYSPLVYEAIAMLEQKLGAVKGMIG